jgi:hypothetical protein
MFVCRNMFLRIKLNAFIIPEPQLLLRKHLSDITGSRTKTSKTTITKVIAY